MHRAILNVRKYSASLNLISKFNSFVAKKKKKEEKKSPSFTGWHLKLNRNSYFLLASPPAPVETRHLDLAATTVCA
ncbi:hypothetical protein I7I53_07129 [Histoplasma capsulatum var. duboisii H88]|uniref:Uncharacterized protein n=1 Tax=Ajellomyces capsulatus (strain H88) TaxID=544711 RepID=A0A8A1LD68_AJEC8|nr:hypothetical protein I7I53_07129 [Histoplasma capsulatum var. duboisii H88]